MKIAQNEYDSQPINIIKFYIESLDFHYLQSIYSKHKHCKDVSENNVLYITFEDSMEIDMLINMLKNYKDDIKQTTYL